MFKKLIDLFFQSFGPLKYRPVKHTVFRNSTIANHLHKKGYEVVNFIDKNEIELLLDLYKNSTKPDNNGKGVFFPILNQEVQKAIGDILSSSFDRWLQNFKSINAFAVKTSGETSKLDLHQDLAVIDEEKHSAVAIWIPLQDIDSYNGAIHLIPKSHYVFSPYRCGTIAPIFKNIENELAPYFIPIYLKKGQALLFDSRLFHYSAPNVSGKDRIVVVCRIYPASSDFITYYTIGKGGISAIEMWKRSENYLINKNENVGESNRPENCELLGYRYANTNPLTKKEFERIRKIIGIELVSN